MSAPSWSAPMSLGEKIKRAGGASALCAALLATTVTGAVLMEKMAGTNPHMMGWSARERYFKSSHGLALFLLKGLGKSLRIEDTLSEMDPIVLEEFKSDSYELAALEALRTRAAQNESDTFSGMVVTKSAESPNRVTGYILAHGLEAQFSLQIKGNLIELEILSVKDTRPLYVAKLEAQSSTKLKIQSQ